MWTRPHSPVTEPETMSDHPIIISQHTDSMVIQSSTVKRNIFKIRPFFLGLSGFISLSGCYTKNKKEFVAEIGYRGRFYKNNNLNLNS
jgi:hypothetical protein